MYKINKTMLCGMLTLQGGLLCANYMIWMVDWANLILASGNDGVYKFAEWHLYESGFEFYCIEYTYFNILLLELFMLWETLV